MDHVDLSTGISWHPHECMRRRKNEDMTSHNLIHQAYLAAYKNTQSAVNSVLQKANQVCFQRVMEYFIERTSSTKYPHLLPYRPFPVAAVIAGTDAGAASSALWTEPLIRRLKHRFPFIVSVQRKFHNGRQMLEYVANSIFAATQRRELESQWLQHEMRRSEHKITTRRAFRLKEQTDSDIPTIKWDTVATILKHIANIVTPVMQSSDDVTIQVEMLYMELQSGAQEAMRNCSTYFATCDTLDRLLDDSTDRLKSIRRLVGPDTCTERKLLLLHQWLLVQYKDVVENQLKVETNDINRQKLRSKIQTISRDITDISPTNLENETNCAPCVIVVMDQYESVPEAQFSDFLHMWRDHSAAAVGIGFVLGFSSTFSPCYRRMPRQIATCIHIEPFVLEDSFKSFKDIVQTLVIAGEFPLTLSGAVYEWLHGTFTQTHSIESFLAALKFILYQHVKQPHHVLALFPLKELDEFGLPSCIDTYRKTLTSNELHDISPKMELNQAIDHVRSWKQVWKCMWSCVDMTWQMCIQLQSEWRIHNVQVVSLALDGKLAGSVVARHIYAFLHQAGIRALHSLVLEWRECVARYEMEGNAPQEILSSIALAINEMVQILTFVHDTSNDEITAKMIPEVRDDVWKLLEERILPCLTPSLPLACDAGRLFYFDDVDTLEQHLYSHHETALRQCLEKTLSKSHRNTWAQDMHIMHEFYRHTAGMLINVAEWLDHFRSQVHDKTHVEPRFLCGITTMQYLGYVRRHGKSDDYVEKLVFI